MLLLLTEFIKSSFVASFGHCPLLYMYRINNSSLKPQLLFKGNKNSQVHQPKVWAEVGAEIFKSLLLKWSDVFHCMKFFSLHFSHLQYRCFN